MLAEKTLVTAFYQPSTRTRLAHEAAMHRLGGHVTGFSDAKMTRAGDLYQESIKDTVKMLEFYGDVIVMRHFQQGAPHEAAKWASIPIINGGDGWGEHPTQILTDLYTVLHEKGTHRRSEMAGRRRYAHAHHALPGLCPDPVRLPDHLRRAPDMSLTDEFKAELKQYSLNFKEAEHVEQAIAEADVILVEPVVQPDYTKSAPGSRRARHDPRQLQDHPRTAGDESQIGCHPAAFPAAHGRNPSRCGYHPLVALLAGSLQRRGHAHGAAGPGPGRDGINLRGD